MLVARLAIQNLLVGYVVIGWVVYNALCTIVFATIGDFEHHDNPVLDFLVWAQDRLWDLGELVDRDNTDFLYYRHNALLAGGVYLHDALVELCLPIEALNENGILWVYLWKFGVFLNSYLDVEA